MRNVHDIAARKKSENLTFFDGGNFIRSLRFVTPLSIIVRILLAVLLGGALGFERGRKHRPAGFRTYILVCLGSAMVMMTNHYVYQMYNTSDLVRMGAQVISGVGFLGAGTIIMTGKNQIKGVTTAAGLWTTACCGLAIGIGFYELAFLGTCAALITMTLLQKVDEHIHQSALEMEVYVEFEERKNIGEFVRFVRDSDFEIVDFQLINGKSIKNGPISILLTLRREKLQSNESLLEVIAVGPGVIHVEKM